MTRTLKDEHRLRLNQLRDAQMTASRSAMIRHDTRTSDECLKNIEAIDAALLAHPEAHGWQPIETAPKDEDVLLYLPDDGETEVAVGHEAEGNWYPQDVSTLGGRPFPFQPTHWQPLPPPPTSSGASE